MELRQLRHFAALARTRSITGAARSEGIVQSGLSSSIQMLERELGTDLYLRGTRPVRLTAAGEALVAPARRALAAAAAAERAVLDTQEVLTGQLRLGLTRCAQHIVPVAQHLGQFLADHPGIEVQVRAADEITLVQRVEAGELDCAITAIGPRAGRLRLMPLVTETLVLVGRAGHPLAAAADVTLADLKDLPFLEVPPTWAARQFTDTVFAEAGIDRRIVAEADDWNLLFDLLLTGIGVGFVPGRLLGQVGSDRTPVLRPIPLRDVRMIAPVGLILPPLSETAPVAAAFARDLIGSASG